jgi:hypothetical protein
MQFQRHGCGIHAVWLRHEVVLSDGGGVAVAHVPLRGAIKLNDAGPELHQRGIHAVAAGPPP